MLTLKFRQQRQQPATSDGRCAGNDEIPLQLRLLNYSDSFVDLLEAGVQRAVQRLPFLGQDDLARQAMKSGKPSSCSRQRILWLTALWVMHSSSAAFVKLMCLATAVNEYRNCPDTWSLFWFMHSSHEWADKDFAFDRIITFFYTVIISSAESIDNQLFSSLILSFKPIFGKQAFPLRNKLPHRKTVRVIDEKTYGLSFINLSRPRPAMESAAV